MDSKSHQPPGDCPSSFSGVLRGILLGSGLDLIGSPAYQSKLAVIRFHYISGKLKSAMHGVVVALVQDPALDLAEPGLNPSIQPAQIPLQMDPFLPSTRST